MVERRKKRDQTKRRERNMLRECGEVGDGGKKGRRWGRKES